MTKRTLEDVFNNDPLGLLDVELAPKRTHHSGDQIFSGFNEIQFFYDNYGRAPESNETGAIEELRLAKRLEGFRNNPAISEKLIPYDRHGLLSDSAICKQNDESETSDVIPESFDDILNSELLSLGTENIFDMRHVSVTEKTQSVNPYTANRKPCEDFEHFKPLFEKVQSELDNNLRETGTIEKISEIKAGQWFIVQGMLAYVAEMGEKYEHRKGHHNARLRVVFSNKTESDLLLRSFGAALYKDNAARRVYGASEGPLFGGEVDEGENPAGTIYVLKSNSQKEGIKEHREYLHKIGVTSGSVKARVANAEKDPTYLLASVEVVAEFRLFHMNIKATERLFQKFFHAAQAEIEIKDRFGNIVKPREWFFIDMQSIKDAVTALQNNRILNVEYDPSQQKVVEKIQGKNV